MAALYIEWKNLKTITKSKGKMSKKDQKKERDMCGKTFLSIGFKDSFVFANLLYSKF
jgi:hypothetical protein